MLFVGRERERQLLLEAVRGTPGAALLRGPAGVGKSTLAEVVADELVGDGWTVERTVGVSAGSGTPFGPFLYLQGPDSLPSSNPGEQLLRLTAELRVRAGDGPLLLFVDDAHHLDPASVLLVHSLVTRETASVLLTVRTSEPIPDDFAALVKDGHVADLGLEPLDHAECDMLVIQMLGGAVSVDVCDEVWRVTEGNPLFVREIVATNRDGPSLERDEAGVWTRGRPLGTSRLLRDVVGTRITALDDDARRLLESLALAGPLRLAVAERLLPLDEIAALENDEFVRVVRRDDQEIVDVGHPLQTEIALDLDLGSGARLQAARGAVAGVLADSDVRGEMLIRARLLLDSGHSDPDLFVTAGQTAFEHFDGPLALRCADAARRNGGGFDAEIVRASALALLGDDDAADATFSDLLAGTPVPEQRAAVLLRRAQLLLHLRGAAEDATDVLREGIENLPEHAVAPLRSYLAFVAFFSGRPEEAVTVSEPLIADERVPLVYTGVGYWSSQAMLGRPDRALPTLERAFSELRTIELEGVSATMSALNFTWIRLLCLWQIGRAIEGDDPFQVLRGTSVEHIAETRVGAGMPGTQAFVRGHLDDAARIYGRVELHLRTSFFHFATFNATLVATIHALRGDAVGARRELAFVDATPEEARLGFRWWTERARALTLVAEGDVAGGIARSLELADRYTNECFSATTSLHDVVRLGRADLVADRLVAQTHRDGSTWWDHTCFAHADAVRRGDGGALLTVSQTFEAGGLDLQACEAAAQAAHEFLEGGCRVEATRANARVERLIARCGRLRTPALDRLVPLLTPREHQVAILAASGLGNAEIAERLGTSARTVGNQLQSTYAKLGVGSRKELGKLVEGGRG